VPLAFLAFILVGAGLLMLPVSTESPEAAPLLTALFTAVSAVCVTGLVVVDTSTYWSGFGEAVITVLIQVGGFGIITAATLLGLLTVGRMRLSNRLLAASENQALSLGDIGAVVRRVALITVSVEVVVALVLFLRFRYYYDFPVAEALWYGVFHAVSSFNNAGFGLEADSLMQWVTDPFVTVPVTAALIVGGIGFPVIVEVLRKSRLTRVMRGDWRRRPSPGWSVHTKLTLLTTAVLLAVGFAAYAVFEWTNPATLGPMNVGDKLGAAFVAGAMPRTAGFNNLSTADLTHETWMVTDALMFIGGGSSSTAGGIKVTTFVLLAVVIWSEIRGEPDVAVFGRKIPGSTQRQALTVALLGVAIVSVGTALVMIETEFSLDQVLFESISAFATVGLSTGITAALPPFSQLVMIVLMFAGRVGIVSLATALALRSRHRRYSFPEERPLVG
jgi:potassium uptake TrkH family protein